MVGKEEYSGLKSKNCLQVTGQEVWKRKRKTGLYFLSGLLYARIETGRILKVFVEFCYL